MGSQKYLILAFAVVFILLIAIYVLIRATNSSTNRIGQSSISVANVNPTTINQSIAEQNILEINDKSYNITAYEYTVQQQERGLMNATVTNKTLMLFYFNSSQIYSFWMKNTYSQLDIIWVNYNSSSNSGKIVYIVNASPCVSYDSSQQNCKIYTPDALANYVFEAKDGFVEQNNVSVGDNVTLSSVKDN